MELIEVLRKFANTVEEPSPATKSRFRAKVGSIVITVLTLGGMLAGTLASLVVHPLLRDHIVGADSSKPDVAPFLLYSLAFLIVLNVCLWLGAYLGGFLALTLVRPFLSFQEAHRFYAIDLEQLPSPFARKLIARIMWPFKRYVGWLYGTPHTS